MTENVRHEMVLNGLNIRLLEVMNSKGDCWFVVETSKNNKIEDTRKFQNIETALDRISMYMK